MEDGHDTQVQLVRAKARVAPLKATSIPRLELEAALLGTRLARDVCENHAIKFNSQHYWSDSQTVLCWLKSNHRNYRQYVAFRVSEILDSTSMEQWRYVPTKLNVADDGTKWANEPDLTSDSRWFKGPGFLYQSEDQWPADKSLTFKTQEELRSHHHHAKTSPRLITFDNHSSFNRLLRGLATFIRFVDNFRARRRQDNTVASSSSDQLRRAEILVIKQIQEEAFEAELNALNHSSPTAQKSVDKSSNIHDKAPYIHQKGVLRARGSIRLGTLYSFHVRTRPLVL